MTRLPRLVALACLLAAFPRPSGADAFYVAPQSVQADGEGWFEFSVVLVAGEGCVGWTGYGYQGTDNVDGGLWVDTFCIDPQPIEPGSEVSFQVTGRLVDPSRPGTVWSSSYFCTGGGGEAETAVIAPSVPAEPERWSALKAQYRD